MDLKQAKTGFYLFLGLFLLTAGYAFMYEPTTYYFDPMTGATTPAGTTAGKERRTAV